MLGALCIEPALGYPDGVFQAVGHPVSWIGACISRLERALNRPSLSPARRRANGVAALAVTLAAAASPAWLAQHAALATLPRWAALALLCTAASTLLAQRSLWTHVRAVATALDPASGTPPASHPPNAAGPNARLAAARLAAARLAAARLAAARIVGRDVAHLDETAIARAAIESLAENFSDAVVAPALCGLAAGLPGLALYKAANTADSMIGHRTPRHEAYGWAAARLDDVVNLPAARLAALWIIAAAALHQACGQPCSPTAAARAAWRDAPRHRSPNAGWPEAAMAGALGLRLAGPRSYHGTCVDDAWMGDGRAHATQADLRRALSLYRTACVLQAAVLAALAIA